MEEDNSWISPYKGVMQIPWSSDIETASLSVRGQIDQLINCLIHLTKNALNDGGDVKSVVICYTGEGNITVIDLDECNLSPMTDNDVSNLIGSIKQKFSNDIYTSVGIIYQVEEDRIPMPDGSVTARILVESIMNDCYEVVIPFISHSEGYKSKTPSFKEIEPRIFSKKTQVELCKEPCKSIQMESVLHLLDDYTNFMIEKLKGVNPAIGVLTVNDAVLMPYTSSSGDYQNYDEAVKAIRQECSAGKHKVVGECKMVSLTGSDSKPCTYILVQVEHHTGEKLCFGQPMNSLADSSIELGKRTAFNGELIYFTGGVD